MEGKPMTYPIPTPATPPPLAPPPPPPARARFLVAAIALVTMIVATACPAPTPPPLSGSLSHVTSQRLRVAIIDSSGNTFICDLFLDLRYDLAYVRVLVTSKVRASGWCPASDWINRRAFGRCEMGTNLYACGGSPGQADWDWNTTGTEVREYAYFEFPGPSPSYIVASFLATLRPPSGIGPFPVQVTGRTPQIRCSSTEHLCKFQT